MRLLRRAAAFLWMSPFRAARSRRLTAPSCTSPVAPAARAFLSAVRSAERCARLRTAAARDFRMFFLADAIFGTDDLQMDADVRTVVATGPGMWSEPSSRRVRQARRPGKRCQPGAMLRLVAPRTPG